VPSQGKKEVKKFAHKVVDLSRSFKGNTLYHIERVFFTEFTKARIQKYLGKRENQIHPYIDLSLKLIESDVVVHQPEVPTESDYLGALFTNYGSDKDSRHSHSWVYNTILAKVTAPKILEIGIGTYNQYAYGGFPPGGSLKAWREAFPNALLVGADIDPEAISELQETGYVVDQLSSSSLRNLYSELKNIGGFDLIIDDGFHEPHANLNTYLNLYELLNAGGRYVIEDVHKSLIDFWRVIAANIPGTLEIFDLSDQRPGCDDNVLLVFRREN